jgi:hypothetical protein
MGRLATRTRPAVQKDRGDAVRPSAFLDIEAMVVVDVQPMGRKGLDGAIEIGHGVCVMV